MEGIGTGLMLDGFWLGGPGPPKSRQFHACMHCTELDTATHSLHIDRGLHHMQIKQYTFTRSRVCV